MDQPEPAPTSARTADHDVKPYLRDNEHVLVRGGNATLVRVGPGPRQSQPTIGTLFLTDRRLVNVDGTLDSIELADITELSISGDQLLVSLRGALGAIVKVEQPGEFRSSVADAISAGRSRTETAR